MDALAPSTRLFRKPHVRAHELGDELVLFDPARGEVLALSAAGSAVWHACAAAPTVESLGWTLATDHDLDAETAGAAVQRVGALLIEHGLLYTQATAAPRAEGVFRVFPTFDGAQVEVHTQDRGIADEVRRRFGAMLGVGDARTVGVLAVRRTDGGFHVDGARVLPAEAATRLEALRTLKHEIVSRFVEARPDLLWLHAGAAALDGRAVLLAGAWGSGKSTLVNDLCARGWRYLSDDVVPFDPRTACAHPFPLTLAYRQGNGAALERAEVPGLGKIHVPLGEDRICSAPTPVDALVFPTYVPGAGGAPQPVSAAVAATTIVQHAQNASAHTPGDAVEALCALARRAPAFTLEHGLPGPAARLHARFRSPCCV